MPTKEKNREYQKKWNSNPENRVKRARWNKEWIQNNRERYNFLKSRYRHKLKVAAIKHYSNGTMACALCGFNDLDALCLDHINNDGAQHRKELKCSSRNGTAGTTIYERLKAKGWMPGLQVLCANCNTIKAVRHRRIYSP